MLVELKPQPTCSNARIFRQRKWWPVYEGAHSDPSLGEFPAQLHYHLALNRLPKAAVLRHHSILRAIAIIPVEDVLGYHIVDRPIISGPWSPRPSPEHKKAMFAEWKKQVKHEANM